MNFEKARFIMVEQQIRPWEVLDQDVLDLLMTVKREEFVPAAYRDLAFTEVEIPIGCGQVMLKPVIEGKVLQALRVATLNPAQTLGLDRDLGSIEKGKLADFVVLDRNPLEKIENTDSVALVVKNGRAYTPAELERKAAAAAATAVD